jgi:phosphoglycerate dehydrogenase-like enzyme
MNRPVVLVTRPEYRRGEPVFSSCSDLDCVAAPEDEAGLIDAIEQTGARHLVIGSGRYGERLYAALERGAVLARYGVGHDTVDKARATAAGVLCTNTPDVLQQSVAELTLSMIGAAARHVVPIASATAQGSWAPRQGIELEGKTLALIGCGAIGQAVARIAAAGFGMRVLGYARTRSHAHQALVETGHFDRIDSDFAAVVSGADFVSLHIPGHPENTRFLDRSRLDLLPARAWVINTARGAVVDEAALFDALSEGRLAGAALDVFEREPYQPVDANRDLRTLPNVLLLPHIGSNTLEANCRMAERALRNVRLAVSGNVAEMDLLNRAVLTANPSTP